ncbi:hypothetical protein [Moraxella atlantae]|uniref:Uncharacterized protein n=1 Tax=Faucicola atlantae TaxID=34059 RepID=A0A378Q263_9GAMM|nr:hypothetical protein [Moraxella atlantae]OPH34116.1 hypothetical protein B5J92_08350 [Moraxella atlantae]STY94288.1 Uncharacterised protein [Moraxella atlantae]
MAGQQITNHSSHGVHGHDLHQHNLRYLDTHEPRDHFKGGLLSALVGLLLLVAAVMLVGRTIAQASILLHNQPPSQMGQRLAMLDTPNYAAKPLAFAAPVKGTSAPLTADGLTRLTGIYHQTLEQAELDTGNIRYHVFDPNHALADYAAQLGQTSTAKTFPVCVEGAVSAAGDYGHMGLAAHQVTVRRVC